MSLELVRSFGVVTRVGTMVLALRRFGVPPGGAFDSESFALSMALSDSQEWAWELGLAQATFRADLGGVVAVEGGSCLVRHGDRAFDSGVAFAVTASDQFTVEAATMGARVYVSFGREGRAPDWQRRLDESPRSVVERNTLRVVRGPQADHFDSTILDREFKVSRVGNRVGIRLDASLGGHKIELPSEPQCAGTIQISNDGTPILLGPDGPTIGGYPKVAVVISADIGRLGQLSPGEAVRFETVSIEQARQLAVEVKEKLAKRIRILKLTS